jgi:hypothetical protein
MGNVEILAVPCAKTMAHNDKTNAAPFVILPFVLLSLGVGLACTLSIVSSYSRKLVMDLTPVAERVIAESW